MNNREEEKRKKLATLRQQAEQVLRQPAGSVAQAEEENKLKRLVYELQVYQVELEMQNEELMRSRLEIEKSLTNYANLYEYAPTYYFTLNRLGQILRLNQLALKLLGYQRQNLLAKEWINLVAPGHTNTFYRFFEEVLDTGQRQTCELEIHTRSGERRSVHLQGIATTGEEEDSLEVLLTLNDITELNQAEEARHYATRFRQIIEGMPGLYLFLSAEGKVLEASSIFLQTLHVLRQSVIGRTLPEIFTHYIYSQALVQALQHSLEVVQDSGRPHTLNSLRYDVRLPDGRIKERYWRITHSPVHTQDGGLSYIVHHMTDITKEVMVGHEIRTNRQRFEMLALTSNDIVWEWDIHKGQWWWNHNLETLFGYKRSEIESGMEAWANRIHPEQKEKVVGEMMRTVLEGGKQWRNEYQFLRADGSYAYVLDRAYPLLSAQGRTNRVLGTMVDITEQKQAEQALEKRVQQRTADLLETNLQLKNEITTRIRLEENLRESQLLTQQIVDATPDIVHVFDLFTGYTLYLNHAITSLFGYTLEDIQHMGKDVSAQLIHPDDLLRCRKGMALLARSRTNRAFQIEYRLKDASNNWHWVWTRYAVFARDEKGMPRQVIGIVHDITQKKKYEQRLKQSQLKLRKLNEELESRVERRTTRLQATFEQLKQEFKSRIQVQEALELNHQRFQVALQKSPVILFTQNTDFTYTWLHNALDDMQAEDFIGKKEADLFPVRTAQTLEAIKTRVLQSGKGHREEVCLQIKGKGYYYDLTVEPIFSGGKQVTGIAGAAVDITDTRLARAELARSEQRYRLLTESIPEMIFTTDMRGQLNFANQWMINFTGLPAEALRGEGWWQAIHPGDLPSVQHAFVQGSSGQEVPLTEIRFRRASDGEYIWHLSRIVPIENKEGELSKWIGICTDIHGQKLVETALRDNAQLREAERNLRMERDFSRNLVNNSIDGIITFDAEPRYTSWNSAVEIMYGISRSEAVGKNIFEVFPGYAETEEGHAIRRVLAGEKVTLYNQPYESREGFYEINLIPLFDDNKQVIGGLGILHDVTERIKLEEERTSLQLKRQKELLNAILEAQEAERRRIAEALHNGLGQTLYAAKLNLEHIPVEVASDQGAREAKTKASQLLADAIKETRSISHELIPTILEDFGLEGAIYDICKKYTQASFLVQPEIYGFDEGERLDKYLEIGLYRISQELVNNAVKHAGASKVQLELVKGELGILLKVRDNGKGFIAEQVMQTKKGIGLKTIQDRIKLLNGSMNIQSAQGKGTVVTIKIPFA